MSFQKHWYLGFLGLIGVYELPQIAGFLQPDGSWWDLTGVLWFLWFLYFVPETDAEKPNDTPADH